MTNTIFQATRKTGICLLIAAACSPLGASVKASPVEPRTTYVTQAAEDAIAQDFPAAKNVQWKDANEADVYTAYFTVSGVKTTVNVDKDGTLLSVLRYYDASVLPDRIRMVLTKAYPDRTIDGVTELVDNTTDDAFENKTYQATMEDAGHIYTVKIEGRKARTTVVMDKQ